MCAVFLFASGSRPCAHTTIKKTTQWLKPNYVGMRRRRKGRGQVNNQDPDISEDLLKKRKKEKEAS